MPAFAGSSSFTLSKFFLEIFIILKASGIVKKVIRLIQGKLLKIAHTAIMIYASHRNILKSITAFSFPNSTTNVFLFTALSAS